MNKFPQFYNKIFDYSLKKGTHIKLIDMLKSYFMKDNTRMMIFTKHLHKELPIRLANRVTDLNNLPFGLAKNHSINKVREWYLTSFIELTEVNEPQTISDIEKYRNIVDIVYKRHAPTLITMSKGLYELKRDNQISDIEAPEIQKVLNKFYKNRTEIRILLEQYLELFDIKPVKNYFGIINLQSNPVEIINKVITDIQYICNTNNLNINDLHDIIKVKCIKYINLPCIDHYLYYILFELIKNSIQAVTEKNKINGEYIPCITITIQEIDELWILIKIDDNGIGIKENDMDKIWYYSFSTSIINMSDIIEESDFSKKSPLSGFGYGLPISDIYVNFFNSSSNNIKINSVYKEGTNIYLYLRRYYLF